MDRFVPTAALLAWLSLLPVALRLTRTVRGTSLTLAARWCLTVWLAWGAVRVAQALAGSTGAITALLWYAFAVLLLVPPIAVLGARRPIDRVWNWFVLAPLVLVFLWPALAEGAQPAGWSIETPIVVGYVLVLVMGTGNYLGTRYTLSALLWAAAALQLLLPYCPATVFGNWPVTMRADVAALLLAVAGWLGIRLGRSPTGNSAGMDCAWVDFRDAFGIVWARRVQDRLNDEVDRKNLSIRLTAHGFARAPTRPADAGTEASDRAQAESSLRWLLQKFVDAAWIESRLPGERGASAP